MLNPLNFILTVLMVYLFMPIIGFGVFYDQFAFEVTHDRILILFLYISMMLAAVLAGLKINSKGVNKKSKFFSQCELNKWRNKRRTLRAQIFLCALTLLVAASLIVVIYLSSNLNTEFTPHKFRMSIRSSGSLILTIAYFTLSMIALGLASLTIFSMLSSSNKFFYSILFIIQLLLIVATGWRGLIIMTLLSFIFLASLNPNRFSKFKLASVFLLAIIIVFTLGVFRSGNELNIRAFLWEVSVRFDMFFPQFFNFLEVYSQLPSIGFGFHHFTFPLQIIPSAIWDGKPDTFLYYINYELMNIHYATGNDFSAYAEFIYQYGVALGLVFYGIFCLLASILISRAYALAKRKISFFVIYIPLLFVFLQTIFLTGISNQALIFSLIAIGILYMISRAFVSFLNLQASEQSTTSARTL